MDISEEEEERRRRLEALLAESDDDDDDGVLGSDAIPAPAPGAPPAAAAAAAPAPAPATVLPSPSPPPPQPQQQPQQEAVAPSAPPASAAPPAKAFAATAVLQSLRESSASLVGNLVAAASVPFVYTSSTAGSADGAAEVPPPPPAPPAPAPAPMTAPPAPQDMVEVPLASLPPELREVAALSAAVAAPPTASSSSSLWSLSQQAFASASSLASTHHPLRAVDIKLRPDAPAGRQEEEPQHQVLALIESVALSRGHVVRADGAPPRPVDASLVVERGSGAAGAGGALGAMFGGGGGGGSDGPWKLAVLTLRVDLRDKRRRSLLVRFLGDGVASRLRASAAGAAAAAGEGEGGGIGGSFLQELVAALGEAGLLLSSSLSQGSAAPRTSTLDVHYVLDLLAAYARQVKAGDAAAAAGGVEEARAAAEELRCATLVAALQPAYARHGLLVPGPKRARAPPLELTRPALADSLTLEQARRLVALGSSSASSSASAGAAIDRICQELDAWAEAEALARAARRRRRAEQRLEAVRQHRAVLIRTLRDHRPGPSASVEQQLAAAFPPEAVPRDAAVLVDVGATLEARPGRLFLTASGLFFSSQILGFSLRRALPFEQVRAIEGGGNGGNGGGLDAGDGSGSGGGGGGGASSLLLASGAALAVTDVRGGVHSFLVANALDIGEVARQVLGAWREDRRVAAWEEERRREGKAGGDAATPAPVPVPAPAPVVTVASPGAEEGKGVEQAESLFDGLTLAAARQQQQEQAQAEKVVVATIAAAPAALLRGRSGSLRGGIEAFFSSSGGGGGITDKSGGAAGSGFAAATTAAATDSNGGATGRESLSPLLDLDG